jgi:hypothetical protein
MLQIRAIKCDLWGGVTDGEDDLGCSVYPRGDDISLVDLMGRYCTLGVL